MKINGSKIAEIKLITANNWVSSPLLQSRLGPSSKLASGPIVKALFTIIMRIPEGIRTEDCTGVFTSHNLIPHIAAGVNADWPTSCFDGTNQLFNVLTVWITGPLTPSTARTRISLNVQPYSPSPELKHRCRAFGLHHLLEIINQFVHLHSRIFPSARKHVNISR